MTRLCHQGYRSGYQNAVDDEKCSGSQYWTDRLILLLSEELRYVKRNDRAERRSCHLKQDLDQSGRGLRLPDASEQRCKASNNQRLGKRQCREADQDENESYRD